MGGVRRFAPLLPLACLLISAAPASAATVAMQGQSGHARFEAAAGEANRLTVTRAGGDALFSDAAAPVTAGTGCTQVSPSEVRCTTVKAKVELGDLDDAATIKGIDSSVDGDEGNDTIDGGDGADTLNGEAGDDRITGGGAADAIDGGEGADVIAARDATRDTVACGGGDDSGEADVEDELNADCERVLKPLAPPTVADPAGTAGGGEGTVSGVTADPVAGKSVAVAVKAGRVLAGGKPVDPAQPIPNGTVIDTTNGTLTLTSAADLNGRTQTADFTGGKFVVVQRPGRNMVTELRMRGGNFSACGATSRRTARAAGKKRIRRLWGSGHGRFRTHGKESVATVRGTIWSVEDRCDGTLTRVERGVVEVRDIRTGRKKLVRKGQSRFVPTRRAARRR